MHQQAFDGQQAQPEHDDGEDAGPYDPSARGPEDDQEEVLDRHGAEGPCTHIAAHHRGRPAEQSFESARLLGHLVEDAEGRDDEQEIQKGDRPHQPRHGTRRRSEEAFANDDERKEPDDDAQPCQVSRIVGAPDGGVFADVEGHAQ